ncbi:MAG: signal peptidase I [Bacilli bacterium]|nr:signal peptidase I [Bacilli bacterium]
MFKEVPIRKVINKAIALEISALLLFLFFVLKINKIQLVKEAYIIVALIISFLLVVSISVFKFFKLGRKYLNYYYQIIDFFFLLNIAVLFVQVFFMVAFYPVVVDGSSMLPTLVNDDRLIVQALGTPKRGDIVVVSLYDDKVDTNYDGIINDEDEKVHELVKRVIAVGGDTFYFEHIENDKLQLVVNGEIIKEDYILGNGTYNLRKITQCSASESCTVPQGQYFVMGDNRGNSHDSRDFGAVPNSKILGLIKYRRISFLNWEKVQ